MSSNSTTKKRIQVQVDHGIVEEGNAILKKLGLTPTTAITMFYKRLIAEDGLPFSTTLTEREKDELQIQKMTQNLPTVDLDNPENLKEWLEKDE
ncbi:type II toxin-antitoxin system RelB/DinJ family antitoxin [Lactobacillus sp. PV034]|uniref:type II toxin-antitoxin system RelB/DinJ family antitoxin n=1 Tax=Lactobacillus sp. PV034 TaxID=2594495 RepID=UPI00223EF4EB|nr:type II toxin-antitoxin system RelB/DinJ family antitoxin [Lactobacillus sp. PV034]QNQ80215.1 type II toxin-antitoxin system RelB/DinJ family antitoxin [Lactobacillus sp. PV034]